MQDDQYVAILRQFKTIGDRLPYSERDGSGLAILGSRKVSEQHARSFAVTLLERQADFPKSLNLLGMPRSFCEFINCSGVQVAEVIGKGLALLVVANGHPVLLEYLGRIVPLDLTPLFQFPSRELFRIAEQVELELDVSIVIQNWLAVLIDLVLEQATRVELLEQFRVFQILQAKCLVKFIVYWASPRFRELFQLLARCRVDNLFPFDLPSPEPSSIPIILLDQILKRRDSLRLPLEEAGLEEFPLGVHGDVKLQKEIPKEAGTGHCLECLIENLTPPSVVLCPLAREQVIGGMVGEDFFGNQTITLFAGIKVNVFGFNVFRINEPLEIKLPKFQKLRIRLNFPLRIIFPIHSDVSSLGVAEHYSIDYGIESVNRNVMADFVSKNSLDYTSPGILVVYDLSLAWAIVTQAFGPFSRDSLEDDVGMGK